ncbi:MAG: SDR family oxidoreductase [Proteobacteria bacterium]|nr:SDR family oxidoreductase [Pseudomonadota bacterium]
MLNRLRQCHVLVTGAAAGIGAAITERLGAEGARLCLVDRDAAAVQAQAQALRTRGIDARAHACDVSSRAQVEALFATLRERGEGLDVLVNNAGIIRDGWLAALAEDDWDAVLAVNLKGPFLCCQQALALLRASPQPAIVNIASRAWLGNPGQANYSASKGGLVSLTRTLALELARWRIRVNAVAPGLIDTAMTQAMPATARERLLRMQPGGQMGTPADIAAAVAFLASADAAFISGQILHVDGGKSCGLLGL